MMRNGMWFVGTLAVGSALSLLGCAAEAPGEDAPSASLEGLEPAQNGGIDYSFYDEGGDPNPLPFPPPQLSIYAVSGGYEAADGTGWKIKARTPLNILPGRGVVEVTTNGGTRSSGTTVLQYVGGGCSIDDDCGQAGVGYCGKIGTSSSSVCFRKPSGASVVRSLTSSNATWVSYTNSTRAGTWYTLANLSRQLYNGLSGCAGVMRNNPSYCIRVISDGGYISGPQ